MTLDYFFERIASQYDNALPFVAYRKPNQTAIQGILQENATLYTTTNFTESGFVFSPFDNTNKTVLIPTQESVTLVVSQGVEGLTIDELAQERENKKTKDLEESKQQHIQLVEKSVAAIKDNQFKKVVVSRDEHVAFSESNPISVFKRLLTTYPLAFIYCWYHPKVGLWIGATPETLIKIDGQRLSIMALAGTQNYIDTIDVSWKEKEKQEQKFVTDFIVDRLKPVVEQAHVSGTETVRAGNLLHLRTMISAQLKTHVDLKEVIFALHPTPAVCGLPKEVTKQFIIKNENYDREFYTGFLGELNIENTAKPRVGKRNIENRAYAYTRKSTQLYVNLRCMQVKEDHAIIYVGGGITEFSSAEKEWQETVLKSLTIKRVLL